LQLLLAWLPINTISNVQSFSDALSAIIFALSPALRTVILSPSNQCENYTAPEEANGVDAASEPTSPAVVLCVAIAVMFVLLDASLASVPLLQTRISDHQQYISDSK